MPTNVITDVIILIRVASFRFVRNFIISPYNKNNINIHTIIGSKKNNKKIINKKYILKNKTRKIKELSKGNQQKIQFITSILHNPELIVLDEPFSGLDPVNTELLKGVILELVEKGKYIIMSSHQMTSIEEFCSDVVIINKGKTVLKGNLKEIKNSYPAKSLEIIVNQDITSYVEELGMEIEKNIDNNYEINIENEEQAHTLMKNLVKNDISIEKFELKKPSLNDIFIEKVGA